MSKNCDNCYEFLPLNCGAHGDCNETGLIVPNEAHCPSWHSKDDVPLPQHPEIPEEYVDEC